MSSPNAANNKPEPDPNHANAASSLQPKSGDTVHTSSDGYYTNATGILEITTSLKIAGWVPFEFSILL